MTTMTDGRQADSDRWRQRVSKAINKATKAGPMISVSLIAPHASVDRTFLHRHKDLLAIVHAAELEQTSPGPATTVSRASLQTDLGNGLQHPTI